MKYRKFETESKTITIKMSEYKRLIAAEAMLGTILRGGEYDQRGIVSAVQSYLGEGERCTGNGYGYEVGE